MEDPTPTMQQGLIDDDANNNNNNNKMNLAQAHTELDSMGFVVYDDNNNDMLVGVQSKCFWDFSVKLDTLVFVYDNVAVLDMARINADLVKLPDVVQQYYVGGYCPPFGFSRAILTIVVYYAETVTVEAATYIRTRPSSSQWCQVRFCAAQDGHGTSYMLSESSTPFWGRAFYPMLRYMASRLTGMQGMETPGRNWYLLFLNVFCLTYLAFNFILYPTDYVIAPALALAFLGIMFLWAAVRQCVSDNNKKKKQTETSSPVQV